MLKKTFKFIKAKKIFRFPKKCEILIYDYTGSENFKYLSSEYNCEILHTRGEVINLPCFLFATFERILCGRSFFVNYINWIILFSNPKLVLTFIDNDHKFYKIKKSIKNIKTAFVQNGLRGYYLDVFSRSLEKKENYVDYMFVFGGGIARKYESIINGRTICIGSFKNNQVGKLQGAVNQKVVVFISQWTKFQGEKSITVGSRSVSEDEFNYGKLKTCQEAANWAQQNNHNFIICGRSNSFEEKNYYQENMNGFNYIFVPKTSNESSYKLIDLASFVVSCESTLAIEALGRGKRVAIFNFEYKQWGCIASFGWEADLAPCGPFWTNLSSPSEYNRILNFVGNISDLEWRRLFYKLQREIMVFDSKNSIFNKVIKKLLVN